MSNIIRAPEDLLRYLPASEALRKRISDAISAQAEGHPFAVTKYYLEEVIDRDNSQDPLLEVILPNLDYLHQTDDSFGHITSVDSRKMSHSPYFVQKYESNAILLVTPHCDQFCSHCFRKKTANSLGVISEDSLREVFRDLAMPAADDFQELIISGGEPMTMPVSLWEELAKLKEELNLERSQRGVLPLEVSLNTRQVVVNPRKMLENEALLDALEKLEPFNIGIHILHPREITEDLKKILAKLKEYSKFLFTVHPILKDINNDPDILNEMYLKLARMGVIPKDLIHPVKSGIPASRCIDLEESMAIARDLMRRLPGCLTPKLVCCTPSHGKSTVDPYHLKTNGEYGYDIRDGEIYGLRTKDGTSNQPANVF
ncbi:MAG: radical SAM protein [Candidatus Gracilibacteria bacterium]|nr:radical SAM protein [Candidatus Gracilibacteria bacterium]